MLSSNFNFELKNIESLSYNRKELRGYDTQDMLDNQLHTFHQINSDSQRVMTKMHPGCCHFTMCNNIS